MRKTFLVVIATIGAVAALAPAGATARIIELGDLTPTPAPPTPLTPSCPGNPCLAVSRTTGFQAATSTARAPFVVPQDGRIVAWTIALGNPGAKQISFFNANEGGTASAGITILRGGKQLAYTTVGQSPVLQLEPYFGQNVQFPLVTTLAVRKNDVVALTVPTWAPSLALNLGNGTSWRASRAKKKCSDTGTQTAQQTLNSKATYFCLYKTARLTYSATEVTAPKVNPPKKQTCKRGTGPGTRKKCKKP